MGGGPGAAAPAHRHHRQHPPVRVLRGQAVQPRLPARPARAAGAARVRDGAAPGHGVGPGAAGPRAGRPVRRAAVLRAVGPLGHRAARAVPAAALRDGRPGGGGRRSAGPRPGSRPGLVRRLRRVPLPAGRGDDGGWSRAGAAHRDRAVVRAGGGGVLRGDGALRGLLDRAAAGPGDRLRAGPAPAGLQRPAGAADGDRDAGGVRGGGALPGLAAVVGAASRPWRSTRRSAST